MAEKKLGPSRKEWEEWKKQVFFVNTYLMVGVIAEIILLLSDACNILSNIKLWTMIRTWVIVFLVVYIYVYIYIYIYIYIVHTIKELNSKPLLYILYPR